MRGRGDKGWFKRVFLEDRYHWGNVNLTNPTRNHYTIGFFPVTRLHGKTAKGKIRTIGFSSRFRADSDMYIKDNASYGFIFNDNECGDNCEMRKNKAVGWLVNLNGFGDNCTVKDNGIIGLFGNGNFFGKDCVVEKNSIVGFGNLNHFEEDHNYKNPRTNSQSPYSPQSLSQLFRLI